jgi:hypothetical protein
MQGGLIRERPREQSGPSLLLLDTEPLKPILPGRVQVSFFSHLSG